MFVGFCCIVVECDNISVSIMICLVCSNIVTGGVMLSLDKCALFICVDFVIVCICMVCGFMSWWVVSLAYCHGGSLEALFAVALPMFDVSNV